MSYIEILILRHLSSRPAHGYELRKRVEATTAVVLHNNSMYPALRRFEEAGAVTKTAEPQEGRPSKLVYEVTDTGRELLHDMLAELPPEQAGDDSEFFARLGQFSLLTPAERQAVLDARDRALRAQLEHLTTMNKLARPERWGALATSELIRRTEQELAWITELRVQAAEPDNQPPSGDRP